MSRIAFAVAALGGSLLTATAASAAMPGAACDYYENLLMGAMCQGTADLGLSIGNDHREIDSSYADPFLQQSSKTTYNFLGLGASAAITPLPWLNFTVTSSLTTQTNQFSLSQHDFAGSYQYSSSSQQTYAGFQTLTARAKVLDSSAGNARYVVNTYVTGGFVPGTDVGDTPGQDNAKWHTQYGGGIEANGQWHVPGGAYSIVARSGVEIIWGDELSRTVVHPALSLFLSNDAWGIAVGPSGYVDILAGEKGGVGSSPEAVYLGGEIRTQPLRMLPIPLLRSMTADIGVYHSVGQAAWVDTSYGDASEMVVNAALAWHFYY